MNNCSIWDSISHSLSFTHLSREFSEFERLLVADLGRCFFTWDVPCFKASTQQVNKTDFQSLQNSRPGINSEAQKSLASHISPCFTVRNMSSQMNDYPTLQYTTDLHCSKGARQRTRRKEEKERIMEQSWVVPAALPSVTVMAVTCDMLKQLSCEVLEIILDCFHLQAPDSPLGIPVLSEFKLRFDGSCWWLASPSNSYNCRNYILVVPF